MNTLKEAWDEYSEAAVPKGASEILILHTRQAFYAGALAYGAGLFVAVKTMDVEKTADLVTSYYGECEEFFEQNAKDHQALDDNLDKT